jgi:hypothetical protein
MNTEVIVSVGQINYSITENNDETKESKTHYTSESDHKMRQGDSAMDGKKNN